MMIMRGLSPYWCGFWKARRAGSATPPTFATWLLRQAVYILTLLLVLLGPVEACGAQADSISSNEAYARVRVQGILQGDGNKRLEIKDVFDLGRVLSDALSRGLLEKLAFRNVMFAGGIRAEGITIGVPVSFEQCGAEFISIKDVNWTRPVKFIESKGLGRAFFKGGRFEEKLEIINSKFTAAYFKRVVFKKSFSLLKSRIEEASFSGSQFLAPAAFDETEFEHTAKFYATRFGADVSFAEVIVNGAIFFQRVEFTGDAEFTRCKLNDADFGREWTTIFSALADFRGCDFGKAVFDKTRFQDRTVFDSAIFSTGASFNATEFNGRATFTGTTFSSDVSFENAHFADSDSSLEGIVIKGSLEIAPASIGALHFRWDEIEVAVLTDESNKNHASIKAILESAQTRLNVLNQTDDACRVKYLLAAMARRKALQSSSTSMAAKIRIQAVYILWGLPTAYGTKPWPYVVGMVILTGTAVIFIVYFMRRHRRTLPASIFISYRRAITEADARLIHDDLERRGVEAFMDVDDIGLGPFPEKLSKAIDIANVLLVVIGPGWTDIADEQGNRRLDNPDDWVRREISLGIEKGVLIVPVLVREEAMPDADSLPPAIRTLTRFQAVTLRNAAWKRDFDHLVKLLVQNAKRSTKLPSTQTELAHTLENTEKVGGPSQSI